MASNKNKLLTKSSVLCAVKMLRLNLIEIIQQNGYGYSGTAQWAGGWTFPKNECLRNWYTVIDPKTRNNF